MYYIIPLSNGNVEIAMYGGEYATEDFDNRVLRKFLDARVDDITIGTDNFWETYAIARFELNYADDKIESINRAKHHTNEWAEEPRFAIEDEVFVF